MCGYILPSTFWATRAVFINFDTIGNPALYSSFITLATFTMQKRTSLLVSGKWKDPTMKQLFGILQSTIRQSSTREQELLDIIKVLCDSGTESMIKILNTSECPQYDSLKAHNEA
ncbi:predicted protein [Lichtheimia corymbifera JMRC:FSU:9682]|uniref:Uncharacterized protein n=1 Tax=Lichtheimia corymbifera JMRC:FSU:9682 TaxID=1263082 RepID=A0A068SAC1_9FUNG|nr:predicted protein [Lichtheimia corymbifera JMRC:FSU:9682]